MRENSRAFYSWIITKISVAQAATARLCGLLLFALIRNLR